MQPEVAVGTAQQRVRSTMSAVAGTTPVLAAVQGRAVLTQVSLHIAQVFRLLLKTSVERNTNELHLFLDGSAAWLSLVHL